MKNRGAVKNLKFTSESVPYSQSICTFVCVGCYFSGDVLQRSDGTDIILCILCIDDKTDV